MGYSERVPAVRCGLDLMGTDAIGLLSQASDDRISSTISGKANAVSKQETNKTNEH